MDNQLPMQVWVNPELGPPGDPAPMVDAQVVTYPHDPRGPWWPGVLQQWRWDDADHTSWTGLVEFRRPNNLGYSQWVPGRLLKRADDPSAHE